MDEEVREVKVLEKPWVEKYRPQRLDDIVGQEHIVKRLKHYVKTGSMPHLLFAGPPGTGKTTSALALARELFGENWRHNFLELNASVSKDTPILVRINGRILRTTFAELDRMYFEDDDGEVSYKDVDNLEVLTVDENYRVRWAKVSKIIRHRVPVILRVHLEGGGKLELTGNHSVIVLTENGLETIKASELKEGSILLSFTTNLEGFLDILDLTGYSVRETPRTRVFTELSVDEEISYMLGLYAAEGAVGFRGETSGQVIYTLGAHEKELIDKVRDFAERLGISVYENYTSSGFDRGRKTAYQVRLLNTQLAKFFEQSFYDGEGRRAENKRVPGFVFEFPIHERIAFLRGLADGDGSGEWKSVIRISSVSRDMLIDVVWLARISGIEASIFEREARLIWKGGMKWAKAELLPAEPIVKMLKKIEHAIEGNWRYELRHQLYEGKKRVRKETLRKILDMINEDKLNEGERRILETLKKLAYTDLHALMVKKIELVEYNDFVYDVSVPGNEMFFAGEIPVLLHNSDERGINVIREKVKEFARTKPIGGASFKIIFLDEADALTQDAQQALRRTMEMFSSNVRFILSCNFSSRIIEPIQSRCAIFRFRPLRDEDIAKRLRFIAENEGLELTEEGLQAILYIAEGDMRRAINILQAAAALDKKITDENVFMVASRARPEDIREMMLLALEGNFLKAREKLREILLKQGLSGEDVLVQMHKEVFNLPISEPKKVQLADKIGEYNFRLVEGANEMIQLEALLAQFTLIGKK
ncbi:replication factor C small subunit [Pyrococcus kukulkanii]|uniref:replication factor C small subunit n=1 Tax=Pyrococcus kukulkanii TaxID=1609559 RepID=UPI003561CF91